MLLLNDISNLFSHSTLRATNQFHEIVKNELQVFNELFRYSEEPRCGEEKSKIFSCNLHKCRKYHHFNKGRQKYEKFTLPLNHIKREMNYYKRGLAREQYKP